MKKIITLLLSFILLTSVTACTESPEKLYGFYKDIDKGELVFYGKIALLSITKDEIKNSNWNHPKKIIKIENKNDTWFFTVKNEDESLITIKETDENTIEYIDDNKKSVRKFIKISEEEFKKLQEINSKNKKIF